jgi:protein O-mannosyl-transferase
MQPKIKSSKNTPDAASKNTKATGDKSVGAPRWLIYVVLLFTAMIYSRTLQNGLTFDDDDNYILQNPYLRHFSWDGIKAIFSSFYSYNYHPLTTTAWLFLYKFFALNPLPYHLLNVVLHVANTFLVYKLAQKLSGKEVTAIIVSALFALHPMHVESVAWVSELKGVLYSFFYLLAIVFYLQYINGAARKYFVYALVCFIASLLSKPAAVTLPVLLLIIDWYRGRGINSKTVIEKVPYFMLSAVFSVIAIMSQQAGGAVNDISASYGAVNRIFLFTSGIASYLLRLAVPVKLAALHYFPNADNGALPWEYYCSLPFLLAVGWLVARIMKREQKPGEAYSLRRDIIFGLLFFAATIFVMLQIIAVGSSLIAERYTYIPYIGLFYIAGQWTTHRLNEKNKAVLAGLLTGVVLIFALQAWTRIADWKDTDVLFTDIVEKNKDNHHNFLVYTYWGDYKKYARDMPAALQYYSQAIAINPSTDKAYFGRGTVYEKTGNPKAAVPDYNKAISLNADRPGYYNYRGWAYYLLGDKTSAMADFNKALSLDSKYPEAYNNRGWAYFEAGDTAHAMKDFNTAISLDPMFTLPYFNRAAIKANSGQFKGAIEDYTELLKFSPNDSLAYFNRGLTRINIQDKTGACEDLRKAMEMGYPGASQALNQYCR